MNKEFFETINQNAMILQQFYLKKKINEKLLQGG